MKLEHVNVSGLNLFAKSFALFVENSVGLKETDSLVENSLEVGALINNDKNVIEESVISKQTTGLGSRDRFSIAKLTQSGSDMLNRGLGLIHLEAIITATPKWFKRSGASFYVIRRNSDGTLTASVSLSYYRIKGLWQDDALSIEEEWNQFWNLVTSIPYFDLFISCLSDEYLNFE